MKYIKIMALYFAWIFVLVSCNSPTKESRNTGILANNEVVSSIKQEIADRENLLLANKDDVFWSPSGTIWHASYECSYLANSKIIYHGTVEEAKLEGKERFCERCAGEDNNAIYEKLAQNEIKSGDVFFTKDGDTWHKDLNCEKILGSQKIYYASLEIAKSLGKVHSCENCDK